MNLPLAAGVTHILHLTWPTLGGGPASLGVDRTGDGAADEFMPLDNQAPSTAIWTGWVGGKVRLEMETRDAAVSFRVLAPSSDPLQVDTSRDLVDWSSSGMVPANAWLPLSSLAGGVSADEGPVFVRIRR